MEYNEPLNLSIKKKPIAVVTPSSSASNKLDVAGSSGSASNDADDPNERLDTSSPSGVNERDNMNQSSPVPNIEDTSACRNATDSISAKRSISPIKPTPSTVNEMDESSNSSVHNLNLVNLLYGNSAPSLNATEVPRSPSVSGLSTYTAAQTNTLAPNQQQQQQQPPSSALSASILEATNSLNNYLNQQKSLGIAKMHLERYLKVTNQYLHATLDGANLTSNEQINHLIRTNILTNKIAANNLISIINKLLEQNIISEYYFKHASRLMMQSYENVTATTASNFPELSLTTNTDKDAFDLFDKSKLSPTQNSNAHQPSELLKELIKQREIRFNEEQQDDDGDISDSETNDNPQKVELLDYDDTIKKETIPVHANPFMSYLHMHLNRSLDKGKTDTKYFNGASIVIPNSVSPTDSTSLSPLIAPIEGKTKSHKKRTSNHHSATANNFTNNNNNNSHSKSTSRSSRFDLALNLSQRTALDQQKNSPNNMHIQQPHQPHHHSQQPQHQTHQQTHPQHHSHHQQSQSHQSQSTHQSQQEQINEKKKPHIKKPLNAFMLYMKEMRAKVVAECTLKESAAINQILGRRWHALGREEQAKYYELARRERQLHMQMYPDWSSRTNASRGKKRKRKQDSNDGGNNMKKCRARFGLDQQNQWCKPCRRKKKCIRYMEGDNDERTNDGDDMRGGNISDDNLGSCGSVDDVKTPPEDDIESLNHSLSSPGAFSGLSYLQSPSTNLASPLRTNSILYNSNNLSQTHTENSHNNSANDSNNNSNPNNSTNSHNISSIIK
ncbi:putative uncharacterized protein DDB_G0277255 isoform X2 [Sitodiplosis mosellana]|uniref:putative uncharacterized protein DDB_G0277255 isoform X2 n=1 Tax=Sitodiplosis mosellana TaxID=263140 RepID=UPI0024438CC9|nr:putative uncharacterized protein DDB_G0277255 isoform X2 [Sitodiplosis mosellana]